MTTVSSAIDLVNGDTAPANPSAANLRIYIRGGVAYYRDSAGVETQFVASPPNATFAAAGLETAAEHLELNSLNGQNSVGAVKRVFRPGDYMVGNTYDPTGAANSTTSFAAAMAAAIALNDRCIFEMPPGVFKVDPSTLAGFGSAPITIRGAGRGVTVLIPSSGASDFLTLNASVDGCEISDFAIYNTSGTPFATGNGINTNGADDVAIHDMLFVDLFNDINVNGSSIKVSMQRLVHSQSNGNASSVGILVSNGAAGDTYIGPDIVMSNTGATRRRASVEIAESGHYEVNQCNLTGSGRGIYITPAAGKIVAFGFHSQVLCDSCTVAGMTLNAGTATSTIKNIKSVNSWYSGTLNAGNGVVTSGVAGGILNGVTFSNDRFLNNGGHGFSHTFGTDFRWADCDMKGNSLPANGGTTNTSDGLNVAVAVGNWSVNGGKFGGSDTVPTATTQRYGINAAGGGSADFVKLSPDDLSGNATGPLNLPNFFARNAVVNGCPGLPQSYTNSASTAGITTTITTVGNVLIPKNSVRVGTTFRIKVVGQISALTVGGAVTFSVRLGAANDAVGAAASNAIVVSAVTGTPVVNQWMTCEFLVTVTATGAAGNVNAAGGGTSAATAFTSATLARAANVGFLAVDTTADKYLTVSAVTAGTETLIVHNAVIEVVSY